MRPAWVYLIAWHGHGQLLFAALACSRQAVDRRIAAIQKWAVKDYARPAPVSAVFERSALLKRFFEQRFKQATGLTPLEYIHALRLP